jgi:hypothetical protein
MKGIKMLITRVRNKPMLRIQSEKSSDEWGETEWSAILAEAHQQFIERAQMLGASGRPIVARYKEVTNDLCVLCGAGHYLCGFDFMMETAGPGCFETVCEDCVEHYAPELLVQWPWETRIVKAERAYFNVPDRYAQYPVFPWTDYAQMLLALENLKSTKQLKA